MLEKVNQLAEQAASNVSRRQVLGRFGRGAVVAVAALGGLLALTGKAEAGRPCNPDERKCRGRGGKCYECHPKSEPCPVVRCV